MACRYKSVADVEAACRGDDSAQIAGLCELLSFETNKLETLEGAVANLQNLERVTREMTDGHRRDTEKARQQHESLQKICKDIRRLTEVLGQDTKMIREEGTKKREEMSTTSAFRFPEEGFHGVFRFPNSIGDLMRN